MKVKFNYIRNRISEYRKEDLFTYCFKEIDDNKNNKLFPVWYVLTLIKWTICFGGKRYPPKILNKDRFNILCDTISKFNEEHVINFMKYDTLDKAFLILSNQQSYLQKTVYKDIYSTQLKLFSSIKSRYNIEDSFISKTGLSILDFLILEQIFWIYINIDILKKTNLYFDGYINEDLINIATTITTQEKVRSFLNLLTLDLKNAEDEISNFRHQIRDLELQTMEISFFTMFPFVVWNSRIKLVHADLFKHSINYYIYDYLKNNDPNFTTEFGKRLEKFVELGLMEIGLNYKTEKELKNELPSKSKLVDFYISTDQIYIECKAIETSAHPHINPKDDLIYSSLKSTLFKAYFEQLYTVSKTLNPNRENWGIIITYKEFHWSDFKRLFEIGKNNYELNERNNHIPPENVFIIDIYTWNKVIQIIKDKKSTLLDILKKAKANNSNMTTSKQVFDMHLNEFKDLKISLSYLKDEDHLISSKI